MKETAEILNEILDLNGLMGVTLIKDEKAILDDVDTLKDPLFYCVMLKKAASERKIIFRPWRNAFLS